MTEHSSTSSEFKHTHDSTQETQKNTEAMSESDSLPKNGEPADDTSPAPDTQDDPKQSLEYWKTEAESMKEKWLRSVAEQENLHRRFDKEKESIRQHAITSFAKEIITLEDSMDQALIQSSEASENNPDDPTLTSFHAGLELMKKSLSSIWKKFSIQAVGKVAEPFSPHYHQEMFKEPSSSYPPHTITQVLQRGYKIHDRLLRPALVAVAEEPSTTTQDDANKNAPQGSV